MYHASRIAKFQLDSYGIDHRLGSAATDDSVKGWLKEHRGNPGAMLLYFDVFPSHTVRNAVLQMWCCDSPVRMVVGDHHVSEVPHRDEFRASFAAAVGPTCDNLQVYWGDEGSGVAGCTLAAQWAGDNGWLPPDLNRRVLEEIAYSDTTGKATLLTRYLKSDVAGKPPMADIITCTPEAFDEFERIGQRLFHAMRDRLTPVLVATRVAAASFCPKDTTVYVVAHSDARDMNDLAEWLWEITGAADGGNALLLMRTTEKSASFRNSPHSVVNALDGARFFTEKFHSGVPAGGHGPAAAATLPAGELDAMFASATELKDVSGGVVDIRK